jgi:hypothetical protein
MEKEFDFPQKEKPHYFQKNIRKISYKKNSIDSKTIKNKFNNYNTDNNTDFVPQYKRTQSPVPIDTNSNLSFRLKINETEQIDFDYNNVSSFFNIDLDNMINLPEIKDEKFLDFDIYSPLTDLGEKRNFRKNNLNFEENLSSLCKYGLRYVNNDIYNQTNDKNDKIIFLQSCIRSFLLRKKINFTLLNKIYLEKRNIKKIILLQNNIRCFLAKLRIRKKLIINYIKQKRKNAIKLIINKMRSYLNILKMKKLFFIKYKIEERNKYAKYIQENFRNYIFYNSFKKLMKDINEKYFIIYPSKGNKVELLIYTENESSNNNLISKRYTFDYNKLLNCFVLFINPNTLYAGKYKCQFIIDDIVICDKNYPYIQYKNELYNIIEFKSNKKNKENKENKDKKKKKKERKNNIKTYSYRSKRYKPKSEGDKDNKKITNNYHGNKFCQEEELNDELEDIKEEEDEGKSTTSNNKDCTTKKAKEYINIDDIDFTEEDIINIKKLKGKNIISTDYKKLREELISQKPINNEEKIRKNSFKNFNFNY